MFVAKPQPLRVGGANLPLSFHLLTIIYTFTQARVACFRYISTPTLVRHSLGRVCRPATMSSADEEVMAANAAPSEPVKAQGEDEKATAIVAQGESSAEPTGHLTETIPEEEKEETEAKQVQEEKEEKGEKEEKEETSTGGEAKEEKKGEETKEEKEEEAIDGPKADQPDESKLHPDNDGHEEPVSSPIKTTLTLPKKVADALNEVHQSKIDDAQAAKAVVVNETDKPSLPAADSLLGSTAPKPSLSAPLPTTKEDVSVPPTQPVILGLAVVDFNHLVGPQVEYAHPKELLDDEDLVRSLPFLALPDGSHLSDEDFCYFHLNCPKLSDSTIFGISCNRQIASDALIRKGAEVTRSTVQKAVVVLAKEPVFGPIREKLGIVTRAFFAQGDLADVDILVEFHATLEVGLHSGGLGEDREAVMYMGRCHSSIAAI